MGTQEPGDTEAKMGMVTRRTLAARRLQARLEFFEDDQLALVEAFVDQLMRYHDPDVVRTFLAWRSDPRLGSILELAADIGEEDRDQLLFYAEELYGSATQRGH